MKMHQLQATHLLIDLGSNALRASFYLSKGPQSFELVHQERFPIRLGQEVFLKGPVSDEKIEQLEDAFATLWLLGHSFGVQQVMALGTSALREATNREVILARLKRLTGFKLQVISGDLEAQLVHGAVKPHLTSLGDQPGLQVDIGGGSIEIILTHLGSIKCAQSLPLGTVRLLHLHHLEKIEALLQHQLQELKQQWQSQAARAWQKPALLFGTGGNFKTLEKMLPRTKPKKENGAIALKKVSLLKEQLLSVDYLHRQRYFSLKPDRADVIVVALVIIEQLMTVFEVDQLIALDTGLEEGALNLLRRIPASA